MTAAEEEREEIAQQGAKNFWSLLTRLFGWFFCIVLTASCGEAIEDICPGGASARSDIQWCIDFDSLSNCTTGLENTCWTDNGYSATPGSDDYLWKIAACPGGAVIGSGCSYSRHTAGGTGSAVSKAVSPTTASGCIRGYVKFTGGFLQASAENGNHAIALNWTDGSSCSGIISIDWYFGTPRVSIAYTGSGGSCSTNTPAYGSGKVDPSPTTWAPKNGYWHLFELCAGLNTSASGTGLTDGNGTVSLKLDGSTYVTASNINFRGASTTAKINNVSLQRQLYGPGVPGWRPTTLYDQFAFSADGTAIGAASGASQGSQDTSSPYVNIVAYHGFQGKKLSGDCTTTASDDGYVSTGLVTDYRDGPAYSTSIKHDSYVYDSALCGAATTQALKSETSGSGDGAGFSYPLPEPMSYGRLHLHTWVYLPSTNSYSSIVPLSGFIRYGSVDWTYKYGFYRTSGGKFGLHFDNGSATAQIATSTDFATDTWHEVEIAVVQATNKCSAWLNGTWIINNQDCSQAVGTWLWDYNSTGPQQAVIGIIGDAPASTFTVYNDDTDILTASAVDCTGWGADCPFNVGSGGTVRKKLRRLL